MPNLPGRPERACLSDAARDLPDVSLFAGDGHSFSFYVVCDADAIPAGGGNSCCPGCQQWGFTGVGGTSAAAPAFAGIMALVNQKTGERQGNANYVLYPLAAKNGASCASSASMAGSASNSSCIFYDVVTGNNSVACAGGSPGCSSTTSGGYGILEVNPPTGTSPAWTTTPGYDLATGLGSVNAANLVNNWTSVSFAPTTTTLTSLSPTTISHGQPVNFTISVASGSGAGTPTGDVSLIAQAGNSQSNSTGVGSFALSNGSFSGTTNMLPSGFYGVTAHYAGDGTYGASDSNPPVQVSVSPEASQTHVALLTFDPVTGKPTSSNATSFQYGSVYTILRADVTNSSGQPCFSSSYPCPTGYVHLSDNGLDLDYGSYYLNSQGFTEDQFVQLGGSNNIVAGYRGDSSYGASASRADVITVTPAATTTTLSGVPSSAIANIGFSFNVAVATQSVGLAPAGDAQLLYGNNTVDLRGTYNLTNGSAAAYASTKASVTVSSLPPGPTTFTVEYPGNNYYTASTSAPATVTISDFSVSGPASPVNISAPGQSGTASLTLASLYGFTGTVNLTCNGGSLPGSSCTVSPASVNIGSTPVTATLSFTTTAPVSGASSDTQHRAPHGRPRKSGL